MDDEEKHNIINVGVNGNEKKDVPKMKEPYSLINKLTLGIIRKGDEKSLEYTLTDTLGKFNKKTYDFGERTVIWMPGSRWIRMGTHLVETRFKLLYYILAPLIDTHYYKKIAENKAGDLMGYEKCAITGDTAWRNEMTDVEYGPGSTVKVSSELIGSLPEPPRTVFIESFYKNTKRLDGWHYSFEELARRLNEL